jgi:hypothetical protein
VKVFQPGAIDGTNVIGHGKTFDQGRKFPGGQVGDMAVGKIRAQTSQRGQGKDHVPDGMPAD